MRPLTRPASSCLPCPLRPRRSRGRRPCRRSCRCRACRPPRCRRRSPRCSSSTHLARAERGAPPLRARLVALSARCATRPGRPRTERARCFSRGLLPGCCHHHPRRYAGPIAKHTALGPLVCRRLSKQPPLLHRQPTRVATRCGQLQALTTSRLLKMGLGRCIVMPQKVRDA